MVPFSNKKKSLQVQLIGAACPTYVQRRYMEEDYLCTHHSNEKEEVSHPLTKSNRNLIVSQTVSDLTSKAELLALSQSELKNYLPLATNSL